MFNDAPQKCPVCLEYSEDKKFIQDYSSSDGNFSLFECPNCLVQFWIPFKNPGSDWYENSEIYHNGSNEGGVGKIEHWHKKFFDVYKFKKDKKILDVGCGRGEFLNRCRKQGFSVFGFDFDSKSISFAKEKYNLEISRDLNFKERFDVITFFEVIEHLDNPKEFFSNFLPLLNKGGRMFVSTPSRDRIFANRYLWDYPQNHLSRWSEDSIKHFFTSLGAKEIIFFYNRGIYWISDLLSSRLRTGIVKEFRENNSSEHKNGQKIKSIILMFLVKIRNFLFFLISIPLFVFGKLIGKKGGDMLIEIEYEN